MTSANSRDIARLRASPRSTVLLAGAAGFIGSHLADRLLTDGYRVIGVDNLITGRRDNIAHLDTHPHFQFIKHDITTPLELTTKLDWVMHFASPASPPKYLQWPLETLNANGRGTHELLDLASRSGACFFLASTSEVYGDALEHPQTEDYWGNVNPIGPRSVYDESKRYAEALTMSYYREYRQPIRMVRIFNTYGGRMDAYDGRVVTNFVRQALQGKPITIYGDGRQTRSLQHVDDLVEAIVRLMNVDHQMPLNLGNPEEVSVLELAQMVLALVSSSSSLTFHPLPKDDPRRRQPDISKARRLLDWEPRISIVKGLIDVIADLEQVQNSQHTPHQHSARTAPRISIPS